MEIRSFIKTDEDDVIALWDAAGLTVNPLNDPRADIALCRSSGHGVVLVGVEQDQLIATIMVGHEGHRGWFYYLATEPARQQEGLGRAMVAAGEAWLEKRGLPKSQLMVRDINATAIAFYDRLGYVEEQVKVLSRRLDGRPHAPVQKTVDSTITYLEMTVQPVTPPVPVPAEKLALLRCHDPSVGFYRYLYDAVGRKWQWTARKLISDEVLNQIIGDDLVEIFVLYDNGEPAGFVEIDRRRTPDIQISYFGIVEHYIGRGLGPYMLDWAIRRVWTYIPNRLILDTCTLDHPKALSMYQRAGFTPYKQETVKQVIL